MKIIWLGLITVLVMATSQTVLAETVRDLAPLGPHYPMFIVEKNENPQNILVAYTKLDGQCRVLSASESERSSAQPFVDYYWLMDRERYKPVHRLIKSGIRDRLELRDFAETSHRVFDVRIADLKELKQDLGEAVVSVVASPLSAGGCDVQAHVKLGPSDGSRTIKLNSIYTEAHKTLWPPFRKVDAVTLNGTDALSKKPVARTYFAR